MGNQRGEGKAAGASGPPGNTDFLHLHGLVMTPSVPSVSVVMEMS